MRPLGDISRALLSAAAQRPGTARELAERSLVGYGPARYTSTRLVDRGQLVRLTDAPPYVLGVAAPQTPCGDDLGAHLQLLHASFWDRPAEGERDGPPPSGHADGDGDGFAAL
jgi:hypothetical protein